MRGKVVVVETGLAEEVEWRGESYVRHARTRFVDEVLPLPKAAPEIGDRWEPLTVRARLRRMAEVYRRLPHTPDTRPGGYRSCMPTPVREMWKDLPGEPMRLPPRAEDLAAVRPLLDVIVQLSDEQRLVLWAIALGLSDRRLGRELRCSHPTAAQRKQELLALLAGTLPGQPDERDVQLARESVHRNLA